VASLMKGGNDPNRGRIARADRKAQRIGGAVSSRQLRQNPKNVGEFRPEREKHHVGKGIGQQKRKYETAREQARQWRKAWASL